jgi:ABC-type polysaccharide/polyol phosphate transport system ATPase subunit
MKDSEMATLPADDLAVRLTGVSVRYWVPTEPISTLKEHVIRRVQGRKLVYRELLALDRVDIELRRGESLGIIGRNGAGKSTLLKVIARVLRPTTGRVWIRGRVAPLINLGAGFHPELTGRENILLNGAILGFSPQEMERRMESIVDFSELSAFIDAPLRTYSSGMVVRLGFAIASDVDPDILIIDEVLGVGDEAFQKKCHTRMEKFRRQGASILFVSHAMDKVREVCERAIWIEGGRVAASGTTEEAIQAYYSYVSQTSAAHA